MKTELSNKEKVLQILKLLSSEYGDETFVSNGYAYHDDAVLMFTKSLDDAEERGRLKEIQFQQSTK